MQKWQAGRPRNAAKSPTYDQIFDGYEQQYLEMVAGDLITCLVSLSLGLAKLSKVMCTNQLDRFVVHAEVVGCSLGSYTLASKSW